MLSLHVHLAQDHPATTSPRASDREQAAVLVLAGFCQPRGPQAESPATAGLLCCGEEVHLGVLAEELMQKTRHHREVGHLGCVIRDTPEKSKGGGEEGEKEEEKTEFLNNVS